jgi:uncharacterized protein involved in response to NO
MSSENIKYMPIWGLSFRPFFLFGSLIGAILIFIWLAFQQNWFNLIGYYDPVTWHSHEMIYGFSASIIVGFLFTASANWVGKQGINNRKLQTLFFVWVLGRLVPFLFEQPNIIASIVDLMFFPLAMYYLKPYLGVKEQKKNQVFFILFTVLFIGNLLVHLETLGIVYNVSRKGIMLGLGTIIMIINIIGGRVFPFFTQKSVQNARVKNIPIIEKMCFIITFLFVFTNSFFELTIVNSLVSILAGILHLIRFYGWNPLQSKNIPILWILFLGYFWMIVAFLLKGFSIFTQIPISLSTHLFTIGVLGVLIYGMITRVSLGHTGRIIKADKFILLGYILLNVSVLFRVFLPLLKPENYLDSIFYSALLWIIAFILFVFRYWSILTKPRPDGKAG